MEYLELSKKIVKYLSDKKGEDLKLIKVDDVTSIADQMVICTGNSTTHVKALADEVEYKLKKEEIIVNHVEGYRSNSWILLDYIGIVVHVFSNEAREYYNLERLWEDGDMIDIKDIVD